MISGFKGWEEVAQGLRELADNQVMEFNDGQRDSLRAIAARIGRNGVIIADEVGMGKTRIAAAVAKCVINAGGRVAILAPPGLGFQWRDELQRAGISTPPILRSLWQFLKAWEDKQSPKPWFSQNALLVSHAFANWRLGGRSENWRWALVPELYAHWIKHINGRLPQDYKNEKKFPKDPWVQHAAESIVAATRNGAASPSSRKLIQELADETSWLDALNKKEFGSNKPLRPWLERSVGLGLGVFDLVILDEAHKSRGHESGLNRLLENLVLHADKARRIAMTATPVELDAEQWLQMLERIQVVGTSASNAISAYASAVHEVRRCPSDQTVRSDYKRASTAFKQALELFLLRRDKQESPSVQKFKHYSKQSFDAYRQLKNILVETPQLSDDWKQAVCAAEALSFVSQQADDGVSKRLRLTLGNGHGVAALIDQIHHQAEDEATPVQEDADQAQGKKAETDLPPAQAKRLERAAWWRKVMVRPSQNSTSGDAVLYDHPAILAAIADVEAVCERGEKVLVFGRFTRPLRAMVELLNARAMLRSLDMHQPWPQSKVLDNEWGAVAAAHRQLQRSGPMIQEQINQQLDEQYRRLEGQRRSTREKLIAHIEAGLAQASCSDRVRALFAAFKESVEHDDGSHEHSLAVVARAVQELADTSAEAPSAAEFARAFADLIDAASDRDDNGAEEDTDLDSERSADLWMDLETRLRDEYSRPEGGFARLMYGATKPETRRLLQLAFNRRHGHPKVLVAQSMVGREGLNLHKACRTVVLLHPEWNPGVVEQQIGRVDRIGSLWEYKLDEAINAGLPASEIPKIEIRPVIFEGTYDERNWQVLRDRWDNLRAQLHGIVISPLVAEKYAGDEKMTNVIEEINLAAPDFSPSKKESV